MLCCMCLLETPQMLGIFDENGLKLEIANTINTHFWFKATTDDMLTSHICTICWKIVYEFHEFYKNVENTHTVFQQSQHSITAIKEEDILSIKQEKHDQDEISCENNLKHPEIKVKEGGKYANCDINLKNPLESEQNLNSWKEEDINIDSESNTSSSEYEGSDLNEPVALLKDNKFENEINKKSTTKRKAKQKAFNKQKHEDEPEKKRNSHRLDPILIEKLIKKHIKMLCDLCVYSGSTFSDIVNHFKEQHSNIQPFIMCCNRKFTRSYCIDQHAIIHENPDFFRCSKCNRSFTTTYGLRTHNLNHHDPEEKRIHACEFCPRRFGRRQLLEVHRQTHIPKEKWTITCTKCTPRTVKFVSQYLLNIHNSMFHKRDANICHVCAKKIKDKRAFEKHVRAHFEESGPRVKCTYPNCGRWLKDEDNLKTHMQLHNIAGKTYKCTECNKECPNRRALTNHKRYVHTNQTFRCEECNKTFKKAISLREHMTQHTGETLYNCPFCTRTFNSNANMHAHKKKQHPIEWKELRRKNIGPIND